MSTELYFSQPLGVSIERDVVSAPLLGLGVEGWMLLALSTSSRVVNAPMGQFSACSLICVMETVRAGGYRRLYDSSPLLIR